MCELQLLQRLLAIQERYVGADLSSEAGRAIVEERYWSLRRQVPIIYLLGLVDLSAMEIATTGKLAIGFNLPTMIIACGLLRLLQWFGRRGDINYETMVARLTQTVWFAAIVCFAVCARCLYLLQIGDAAEQMAVLLFGGLTAIGVAYGLTALPAAGRIPLIFIVVPITFSALISNDPRFTGAAFGLVAVSGITMRLLSAHNRHFTDVVRSRSLIVYEQKQVELAHQEAMVAASTDFLTGLPNRRAFVTAIENAFSEAAARGPFAVALIDLNRFKAVNDTFGHATGDLLLKEVSRRLMEAIGSNGLVARLGGDEFGLVLPGVRRPKDALFLGRSILDLVNGAVTIEGRLLNISACCGLAIADRGGDQSPSRVMGDADVALYQTKGRQDSGPAVFERRMEAPRLRRAQIERALLSNKVCEQFHVDFQPIFDLETGEVIAHEALARWSEPSLGQVPPSEFVPIAEHLNLIDRINSHLMAMAFEEAQKWPESIKLSFNLSAIQVCSPDCAVHILKSLKQADLSAGRLQIEVTETALLTNFEQARINLTRLKEHGTTIVLDDFGAGFASIAYLRELRFDQIKLDGGLVTAAQFGPEGKRLLRAVVGLCEILGVSTVAEHVESAELLKLVLDLGCHAGQGYWLMRPQPPEALQNIKLSTIPIPTKALRAA